MGRARYTWLACGIASIFVGQQLGEMWHFATTVHAACAEHGELIHVESGGPVRTIEPAGLRRGVRPGERHDHHSCVLGLTERESLGAVPVVPTLQGADRQPGPSSHAAPPHLYGVIWRLAPKTSPPA